jgi:hypothetical protein
MTSPPTPTTKEVTPHERKTTGRERGEEEEEKRGRAQAPPRKQRPAPGKSPAQSRQAQQPRPAPHAKTLAPPGNDGHGRPKKDHSARRPNGHGDQLPATTSRANGSSAQGKRPGPAKRLTPGRQQGAAHTQASAPARSSTATAHRPAGANSTGTHARQHRLRQDRTREPTRRSTTAADTKQTRSARTTNENRSHNSNSQK